MAGQGKLWEAPVGLGHEQPFVGLRNPLIQALGKWRFRIERSPTTSKRGDRPGLQWDSSHTHSMAAVQLYPKELP